jgi:hypothetical protein
MLCMFCIIVRVGPCVPFQFLSVECEPQTQSVSHAPHSLATRSNRRQQDTLFFSTRFSAEARVVPQGSHASATHTQDGAGRFCRPALGGQVALSTCSWTSSTAAALDLCATRCATAPRLSSSSARPPSLEKSLSTLSSTVLVSLRDRLSSCVAASKRACRRSTVLERRFIPRVRSTGARACCLRSTRSRRECRHLIRFV